MKKLLNREDIILFGPCKTAEDERERHLEILRYFKDKVKAGEQPYQRVMEHIADAFEKILDEEITADKALGIDSKRGRKKDKNSSDIEMAMHVWELINHKKLNTDTAFNKVGKEFNKSWQSARDAFYKHKSEIELFKYIERTSPYSPHGPFQRLLKRFLIK